VYGKVIHADSNKVQLYKSGSPDGQEFVYRRYEINRLTGKDGWNINYLSRSFELTAGINYIYEGFKSKDVYKL
jgi:hypothetical protein